LRLLIAANCHVPLTEHNTGGMEVSVRTLVWSLAKYARDLNLDLELSVLAHPASSLPPNAALLSAACVPCPRAYVLYGDGPSKYELLAHELAMQQVSLSSPRPTVIHDNTSTASLTVRARALGIPVVRTARLLPEHPAYSIAPCENLRVHLSQFQARRDPVGDRLATTVIPDWVGSQAAMAIPPFHGHALPSRFLISVGRIEKRKGLQWAERLAESLGLPLIAVGPISDPEYAKQRRCLLLGALSYASCIGLIRRAAGLLWTPDIPEPGGRVVLEALASGTRVLGFDVGYLADVAAAGGHGTFRVSGIPAPIVDVTPGTTTLITEREYVERYLSTYTRVATYA
jgi:hypothetical protein